MRLVSPLVLACLVCMVYSAGIPKAEKDPTFWKKSAKEAIKKSVEAKPIVAVAKNVILFLGDGMGIQTVTAARILAGQMKNNTGEEGMLSFDNFQHVGLSKTYNVDHQTPDSAGTGTAYLCGVKTNMGIIGMDAGVLLGQCDNSTGREATSILRWSHEAGKSTGVVTTTRITHATPAASYAHSPHRDWEGSVPSTQGPCTDIGLQLVKNNSYINVIMGGGRRSLLPNNFTDPEAGWIVSGRKDNRNLIQEWIDQKTAENAKFQYVWNLTSFDAVNPDTTDYLMGLFEPNHMQYEAERLKDKAGEPSLAQMTKKAIQILSKNPKGFFLLVEGGRIDHAHHEGNAANALHDTVAFSEAVQTARDMLDESNTLIVTTADHSHVFAFAGYPERGNNILGLVKDHDGLVLAKDNKTYTTLVYGNGPGYVEGPRPNLTQEDATNLLYKQQSAVPISSETHGGEDVAIYAHGAMAHLFHGVHEQHYIPHVMAYASCVGDYADDNDCAASLLTPSTPSIPSTPSTPTTSGVSSSAVSLLVILGQTLATVILKYLC